MSEFLLDLASHQLLRGSLFFLLALGGCRLLAARSARIRYLVWLVMLVSLTVPPLALVHIPLPGSMGLSPAAQAPVMAAATPAPAPSSSRSPTTDTDPSVAHRTAASASWTRANMVALTWALGTLLMLGLWLRHGLRLRTLLARSRRAPAALQARLDQCAQGLSLRHAVPLRICPDIASPCVVRARRPVLLLPEQDFDTVQLHSWDPVLVHELLHVRRRDLWVQHAVTLLRALWFFHPAAWLAARLLARERERAVDEAVIIEGGIDPMQYQKSLVDVAANAVRHSTSHQPAMALSPAASDLVQRIHLLRRKSMPRFRAWPVMVFAALVGLGCVATAGPDDQDDPAAARVQQVCAKHQIQLPATPGKGLPLSAGGVRAMVFVDAKGHIVTIDEQGIASLGDGFPEILAGILPVEIEEEEPPEEVLEEIEIVEEVIEEEEPPEGEVVEIEEVEEVEPVFPNIELHIRALEPTGKRLAFKVNGKRAESVEQVDDLVQEVLATGSASVGFLTVYAYQDVRVGAVIDAVSRIQTRTPKLPIHYAGVPADWEDPGSIYKALAEGCQLQGFGERDVIIVSDARAPWTSHARIMAWLGSHRVARITMATTHEGQLVKLCQYLPKDLGIER